MVRTLPRRKSKRGKKRITNSKAKASRSSVFHSIVPKKIGLRQSSKTASRGRKCRTLVFRLAGRCRLQHRCNSFLYPCRSQRRDRCE
ncbi:MAG: hypothetical protein WDO15_17305 [Bacteroidota bacterium]